MSGGLIWQRLLFQVRKKQQCSNKYKPIFKKLGQELGQFDTEFLL